MELTKESAQELMQAMSSAPAKQRALSMREFVMLMTPQIQEMRDKGYTVEDIVEFLRARGLDLTVNSLRTYLAQPRSAKQKGKSAASRTRTRPVKDATSVQNSAKSDAIVKPIEAARQAETRKEEKPTAVAPMRSSGFVIEPDPEDI